MDASTPIGMAVRNAAARNEFDYDPSTNEQVHGPTGARYGMTTLNALYRRDGMHLEVFVPSHSQFVPMPQLPAGHRPDRLCEFTLDELVPGLFEDRLAFVEAVWEQMPKRQGCEVHIDHPGRPHYEAQKQQEMMVLHDRTKDWVPHPQG